MTILLCSYLMLLFIETTTFMSQFVQKLEFNTFLSCHFIHYYKSFYFLVGPVLMVTFSDYSSRFTDYSILTNTLTLHSVWQTIWLLHDIVGLSEFSFMTWTMLTIDTCTYSKMGKKMSNSLLHNRGQYSWKNLSWNVS